MKSPLHFILGLLFSIALIAPAPASDYTVTAANVVASSSASISRGTAGASITAGQVLAINASNQLVLADANGASPLMNVAGIALNSASSGQPVLYVTADAAFAPGFTVAANAIVILSATPGGLAPAADNATGYYLTVVGVGIGSNKLKLDFHASGVATP